MIQYLIKSTLCIALLFALYKLLFEREAMHHFKRFYLLAGLLLSFIIPLIPLMPASTNTLSNFAADVPVINIITLADTSPVAALDHIPEKSTAVSWQTVVLWLYVSVTAVLALRFLLALYKLYKARKQWKVIPQKEATLVLTDDDTTPHSIFRYIFLSKTAYNNGTIEGEILQHELAHVKQRHTLDVLLMQLLQICFWFNPILFFYRKAMQLNHEFLADKYVLSQCNDVRSYQYLLIDKAGRKQALSFSSQLNYSLTKKRLLMMTRSTSKRLALLKQLALIPTLSICALICTKEAFAQKDTVKKDKEQATAQKQSPDAAVQKTPPVIEFYGGFKTIFEKEVPFTQEGVSQALSDEYASIVAKNKTLTNNHVKYNGFSDADKERLESIYKKMSRNQQAAQIIRFISSPLPLEKAVPSAAQLEAYKDDKVYGVWIDSKRVSNSELNKYTNTDFSQFFVSKLYGNAKKGRTYTHQLDLMTNDFYAAYYKKTMENRKSLQLIAIAKK